MVGVYIFITSSIHAVILLVNKIYNSFRPIKAIDPIFLWIIGTWSYSAIYFLPECSSPGTPFSQTTHYKIGGPDLWGAHQMLQSHYFTHQVSVSFIIKHFNSSSYFSMPSENNSHTSDVFLNQIYEFVVWLWGIVSHLQISLPFCLKPTDSQCFSQGCLKPSGCFQFRIWWHRALTMFMHNSSE